MKIKDKMLSSVKRAKSILTLAKVSAKNTVKGERVKWVRLDDITINPERKALYKQRPENIELLLQSMEVIGGFDNSQPPIVDQVNCLLDGHTRKEAIHLYNRMHPDNPITVIPVIVKNITDEDEARDFIISIQTKRRQIDDGHLFGVFHKLDTIKEERKRNGESTEKYSDIALAKQLNVSERMVSKMRYVLRNATPEQIQMIEDGKFGINEVYLQIQRDFGKIKEAAQEAPKNANTSTSGTIVPSASSQPEPKVPSSSAIQPSKPKVHTSEPSPKPSASTAGTSVPKHKTDKVCPPMLSLQNPNCAKLVNFLLVNVDNNHNLPDFAHSILKAAEKNWDNIDADGYIVDITSAELCGLTMLATRS